MNRQDDPALSGDIVFLFRRIPPWGGRVEWGTDGVPSPASQNFHDKHNELSVNIASETTPETILHGCEGFGLVQFTAAQVRDAFAQCSQPVSICRDDEEPANGHVLICGNATPGIRKRLKKTCSWVDGKWPARNPPEPLCGEA
jgi:hypothetical protein